MELALLDLRENCAGCACRFEDVLSGNGFEVVLSGKRVGEEARATSGLG